jgi:DnaJ-domain-containing protein 1
VLKSLIHLPSHGDGSLPVRGGILSLLLEWVGRVERWNTEMLLEWLARHGAEPLLEQLQVGLDQLTPGQLGPEGTYLVLCGLLQQATEPTVTDDKLDALKEMSFQLGYDAATYESLLSYVLGITERRLRAYAVLGLGLDATPAEMKQAHRQLAKTFHPDRLLLSEQASATRMLARLNEARALLLRPFDEVVLSGEDDLPLDEPLDEREDAETEDYTTMDDEFTELWDEEPEQAIRARVTLPRP